MTLAAAGVAAARGCASQGRRTRHRTLCSWCPRACASVSTSSASSACCELDGPRSCQIARRCVRLSGSVSGVTDRGRCPPQSQGKRYDVPGQGQGPKRTRQCTTQKYESRCCCHAALAAGPNTLMPARARTARAALAYKPPQPPPRAPRLHCSQTRRLPERESARGAGTPSGTCRRRVARERRRLFEDVFDE